MSPDFVLIDATPLTISIDTPLSKAHAIFHMLTLDFCIITYMGRYVGMLFRTDFTELYRKDYNTKALTKKIVGRTYDDVIKRRFGDSKEKGNKWLIN
ncbi:MAG: hypothetical protein EZS28_054724 [Streblomastix strix]|uniref:CBS domain-containing protein n=1 Tax=Streblomastix strix TaxID=222440 RepID=A0A5J4QDT1_9EUKA|nr:MAG: hypothetical protein EZS28_054724 [Streblomastix strix]